MVLMMDVTRSIGYALRFYVDDWSSKTIIGQVSNINLWMRAF